MATSWRWLRTLYPDPKKSTDIAVSVAIECHKTKPKWFLQVTKDMYNAAVNQSKPEEITCRGLSADEKRGKTYDSYLNPIGQIWMSIPKPTCCYVFFAKNKFFCHSTTHANIKLC